MSRTGRPPTRWPFRWPSRHISFHLSGQVVADRLQVDQTAASFRTGFSQANRFDLAAIDELVGEATFQPEQPLNVREPSELRKYRAATTGRNRCHGGFRARGARWCWLVVQPVYPGAEDPLLFWILRAVRVLLDRAGIRLDRAVAIQFVRRARAAKGQLRCPSGHPVPALQHQRVGDDHRLLVCRGGRVGAHSSPRRGKVVGHAETSIDPEWRDSVRGPDRRRGSVDQAAQRRDGLPKLAAPHERLNFCRSALRRVARLCPDPHEIPSFADAGWGIASFSAAEVGIEFPVGSCTSKPGIGCDLVCRLAGAVGLDASAEPDGRGVVLVRDRPDAVVSFRDLRGLGAA